MAEPPLPVDVLSVSALSCAELLTCLTRMSQALFHHLPPSAMPLSPSSLPSSSSPAAAEGGVTAGKGRGSEEEQGEEGRLLSCVCRCPLSPAFLSSPSSAALFHRCGVFPAPSSMAPRFFSSLSSLRSLVAEHRARLRSSATAPTPSAASLDRLSFFSSSLSSLQAQRAAVTRSLDDCRERLRVEVERARAATSGEEWSWLVTQRLQGIARHLGLQSEEDGDSSGSLHRSLLPLAPASSAAAASAPALRFHLASGGSSSCFVVEVRLRRVAASLSSAVESVQAEFLQGDAEVREAEVELEVLRLLSDGRFACLQRKLSHVLAMEALSDRFPQRSLYTHQLEALQAMQAMQKSRPQQPLVVRRVIDGVQLSFHHLHLPAPNAAAALDPLHLFHAPQSTRSRFPSHPLLAFTHSLTFIGMEENAAQSTPHSAYPSFSFLFALSPPILLPSSSLQRLAKLAAPRHSTPAPSTSSHPTQQSPAMSYHHAAVRSGILPIARPTSPPSPSPPPLSSSSPSSSLSARVAVLDAWHEYRVVNDATRVEAACLTSYLALHSLQALPDTIHTLQQCIIFHQLYTSMHAQHPSAQPSPTSLLSSAPLSVQGVEVTAFPPHSIRLRLLQPVEGTPELLVDVRVASVASAEPCSALPSAPAVSHSRHCHLVTAAVVDTSFDAAPPCSDRFATDLLAMSLSIPILVHAIRRKAQQQQQQRAAAASNTAPIHR